MGAFEDQTTKELEINIVVKIGDEYFSSKQVDVGFTIDEENIIVKNTRINGVTFDIRRITTPIGTFSFTLDEYNYNETSSKIMRDEAQFLTNDVVVLLGHNTWSFHVDDYVEVSNPTVFDE